MDVRQQNRAGKTTGDAYLHQHMVQCLEKLVRQLGVVRWWLRGEGRVADLDAGQRKGLVSAELASRGEGQKKGARMMGSERRLKACCSNPRLAPVQIEAGGGR
jgi:hypothetical protein